MFRTRAPLSRFRRISTARLACVRPPASVHPEPGSNSPLYVCLTHSKFFNALVFPYLVVILYVNDLQILRSYKTNSLSFSFRICECKSNTLFYSDQMFLKKILKFFLLTLTPLCHSISNSCASPFRDCKDTNLFILSKFYFKFFSKLI